MGINEKYLENKKKLDIQLVGQNLFLINFEDESNLDMVLEGRPWLFLKQLILFDRLSVLMGRNQIRLVWLPFWMKIGPCPPKCERKDLIYAIGSTFGGVLQSEEKWKFCRLRVFLDVQKPLRRGIFVANALGEKVASFQV